MIVMMMMMMMMMMMIVVILTIAIIISNNCVNPSTSRRKRDPQVGRACRAGAPVNFPGFFCEQNKLGNGRPIGNLISEMTSNHF